jgi:hypothetical protein
MDGGVTRLFRQVAQDAFGRRHYGVHRKWVFWGEEKTNRRVKLATRRLNLVCA